MTTPPAGIAQAAWNEAVLRARGDRARAGRLVAEGRLLRVPGVRRLPLPIPNRLDGINLAIRPRNKR